MKTLLKYILVAVIFALAVNTNAQTVYTYPTTVLTTDSVSGIAYITYPSTLKLNYVAYATFKVDTIAYVDSMLVIHQTQTSIDGSTWFDYGSADTLIKWSNLAEKEEDYSYTDTPYVYMRDKFTQNDSCTSSITGKIVFKRKY